MTAHKLQPGVWIDHVRMHDPFQASALVVRLAQQLGMPGLSADEEQLVHAIESFDSVHLVMNDLCREAIDWLNEHHGPPGHMWDFEPDTLPPADFGLWPIEEDT